MTQERKLSIEDAKKVLGPDYVARYVAVFRQSEATRHVADLVRERFLQLTGGACEDDEEFMPCVTFGRLKKEVPQYATSRSIVGMIVGQVCGQAARTFIEFAGQEIQTEMTRMFNDDKVCEKLLGLSDDDIRGEIDGLFTEVFTPIVQAVIDPESEHPKKFMDDVTAIVVAALPDLAPPDEFDPGRQFALDTAAEYKKMAVNMGLLIEKDGEAPTIH